MNRSEHAHCPSFCLRKSDKYARHTTEVEQCSPVETWMAVSVEVLEGASRKRKPKRGRARPQHQRESTCRRADSTHVRGSLILPSLQPGPIYTTNLSHGK
jgi:hypothetical protein